MMNKETIDNFKNMIQTYNGMLNELEDSKMKEQFKRFIYGVMSNSMPFTSVMITLEGMIDQAQLSTYNDDVYPSVVAVKFWKKVQKIFIDTYKDISND